MYILISIAGVIACLVVVARFEKRMVWPYGNTQEHPQFSDDSGYGTRWVADALEGGFSCFGWAPDLKGPRYKISYALLVSPQRDCFVIIGVGSILNMRLQGTWIYTPVTDGRMFCSTDNQSCVEIDVSRQWQNQWRCRYSQ